MLKKKMSDVSEQIRGVSYKPEDILSGPGENAIGILRANNIADGAVNFDDLVYVKKSKVSQKQMLRKGDILICTSSGSKNLVGKAAQIEEDCNYSFGAFCKVIRPQKINPGFLGMYFQSSLYRQYISEVSQGANINNIKNAHIDAIEIKGYSENEQKKIAELLEKIVKIIKIRKQQISVLDTLIKSRFIEMFGDCIINPKGWKTRCLEEIAEVGSSKRVFVEELQETGIPFYRGTEIGVLAEGKKITPQLFITENHYEELCRATGMPQIGDLLMPSICPDGRIWMVNTDEPFYFKDGRVLWIHAIDSHYNPVFLLYTLKDRIMADYSNIASGTTFAELKIFALKKCQIFDVPITLQNEFAIFVAQTNKSKAIVQVALDKTQLLFDSLMQKYFG